MADTTGIEWCDSTFNPWIGCTKVSPACDDCYAARSTPARTLGVEWGAGQPRRRTSDSTWALPTRWNARRFMQCEDCGWRGEASAPVIGCGRCGSIELSDTRRRVFCASLADVFDNEVPTAWRVDLLRLIEATPNLDWLLLTKRVGNVERMLDEAAQHMPEVLRWPLPNVWLGATVVNQAEADRDVPKLLAVPARVRFLSVEPMLGPIDLSSIRLRLRGESYVQSNVLAHKSTLDRGAARAAIDWVICGGESGPNARAMHPDWARSLRDQCAAAGVPFLFKQWGEWRPPLDGEQFSTAMGRAQATPAFIVARSGTVHCFENDQTDGGAVMLRVGKKAAGRHLDGIEHNGFPEAPIPDAAKCLATVRA